MSDLISRSELIKELNKYCGNQKYLVSENIREIINDQPNAYSVDKVVQELEEKTDFLKNCTKYGNKNAEQQAESYSTMMMYEVADLVDDLTEIVKHGGVSDDVCRWKMDNVGASIGCRSDLYHTGYVNRIYCPYCGKKIKVMD